MRQFGIISSSIWRSKRFRQLSTDLARLTYLYLHTTTHGNSVGAFVLPPEMAALELKRPAKDVRKALEELAKVNLIRHDSEEELIQIVNFFRYNSPSSRKQLAGPLRFVRDALPASPVRDAVACDLVVAMYERAQTWDKDVEARGAFLNEAAKLVKEMRLQDRLCSPEIGLSIELLKGLSDDLLIELPIQLILSEHSNNTTTQTHTTNTLTTHNTGANGLQRPKKSGAPDSTDKIGRSRRPDAETENLIKDLNERRKGK